MAVEPPGAEPATDIEVEVVLALPERQWLARLRVPVRSRLRDALDASGVDAELVGRRWSDYAIGTFGRLRNADDMLADGDRIELYRPLLADPKEARRLRVRRARRR